MNSQTFNISQNITWFMISTNSCTSKIMFLVTCLCNHHQSLSLSCQVKGLTRESSQTNIKLGISFSSIWVISPAISFLSLKFSYSLLCIFIPFTYKYGLNLISGCFIKSKPDSPIPRISQWISVFCISHGPFNNFGISMDLFDVITPKSYDCPSSFLILRLPQYHAVYSS